MKKNIFVGVFFSFLVFSISADDLADILQDLAVQTACLGMYSTAQTGVYVNSRYDDPPDWYTPYMMANRFAAMSGKMTRTNTFYGVCFDYAQFAWDDIKRFRKTYNEAGMKGSEWYIATADGGNPNTIILYDPVSKDNATITSNGIYLREISRHNVYAHDGVSDHAWLWVQHKNGTWYWIDPTWTDNTGYVWWGIVENGKEVRRNPDSNYNVASNYPKSNETNAVANSGTRSPSTTPSTTNTSYFPDNFPCLAMGYNYSYKLPIGFTFGLNTTDIKFLERFIFYISANCNSYYSDMEINQLEWVCGISIALTNWLRIPVGIGVNHTKFYKPIFDNIYFYEKGFSIGVGVLI